MNYCANLVFNAISFTATTDFMYLPCGLLGYSIDFVTLHYQFSTTEFYEPHTMQQEEHIKNACMLFTSNVTASDALTVYTRCSRARTRLLTWICFSCHFLWSLTMTRRSILGVGTLPLAVNHTLIHISQAVLLRCYRPPFVALFFWVATKA